MRSLSVIAAVALSTGCGELNDTSPPDAPKFWSMATLARLAAEGAPYVPGLRNGEAIPLTAAITPKGLPLPLESGPFSETGATATNTLDGPRLNLIPALSEGRYVPYITIEMWPNNFGDIWVQPVYRFVNAEGTLLANTKQVFGVGPTHRFYSPFWRFYKVTVPPGSEALVTGDAGPKTVRDVLATGWKAVPGDLVFWPLVPKDAKVDPAIAAQNPGDPARPLPQGLWGKTLTAEYTPAALGNLQSVRFFVEAHWAEGEAVTVLHFDKPGAYFRALPGEVVASSPIYMWVDIGAAGEQIPLGLPNIGGHAPPFSGRPTTLPNGTPQDTALWDLVHVVRPKALDGAGKAMPFIPALPAWDALKKLTKTRLGLAADSTALDTTAEINALPNVERWAGRMAMKPGCFAATPTPDAAAAQAWATSCEFIDSQQKLEKRVQDHNFLPTGTRVLCPWVLWTPAVNP